MIENEKNDRELRTDEAEVVNEEVNCVSGEVKNALRRMKKGKADGPDELPVEVWKCMGEIGIKFLTRLFNRLLMAERMPEEWKRSVLIPIFFLTFASLLTYRSLWRDTFRKKSGDFLSNRYFTNIVR